MVTSRRRKMTYNSYMHSFMLYVTSDNFPATATCYYFPLMFLQCAYVSLWDDGSTNSPAQHCCPAMLAAKCKFQQNN